MSRGLCDPEVDRILKWFPLTLQELLAGDLLSVIVHGSIIFDDLAPGYGDLDFIVVVKGDLSEEACSRLIELRRRLHAGEQGVFGTMLEGEFLPRRMLDPAAVGKALWWGTSGERVRQQNGLGALVLHFIRTSGVVIWGEDVRFEIPEVSERELLDSLREDCQNISEHGQGGGLHAVEWLFAAARGLLWLSERRLASKSEAADWGFAHARGEWRKLLAGAKQIRLDPGMIEKAEVRSWLAQLTPAIQQARAELERALPPA